MFESVTTALDSKKEGPGSFNSKAQKQCGIHV